VEAARRAVRLDPMDVSAQLGLATALVRTGDATGARASASAALQLAPDDAHAQEVMADAQWLAGDGPSAFAAFRRLAPRVGGGEPRGLIGEARGPEAPRAGWLGTWPALGRAGSAAPSPRGHGRSASRCATAGCVSGERPTGPDTASRRRHDGRRAAGAARPPPPRRHSEAGRPGHVAPP